MAKSRSNIKYHAAGYDVEPSPWEPKIWRLAPLSGLAALLLALLTGVATAIVLATSNNQPLNRWSIQGYEVQPTVVLSILVTVANALLQYAFSVGLAISWWTRASNGTTMAELHRVWNHGQSTTASLFSGKYLTRVAIASICMVLLLVDGPFLQRSSTVVSIEQHLQTNLTLALSPDPLPQGATAFYTIHSLNPNLFTPIFSRVLLQFKNRESITVPELGCQGTCDFEILAPGWSKSCKNWTSPYRLPQIGEDLSPSDNPSQIMFWTNVTYDNSAVRKWELLESYRTGKPRRYYKNQPPPFPWNSIILSTMVKSGPGLVGDLSWKYCILREAVQRYPVRVVNNTLTIQQMSTTENYTQYEVLRDSSELTGPGLFPSTFGGLSLALSQQYSGNASLQWAGPSSSTASTSAGGSPLAYLRSPNSSTLDTFDLWWQDPMDDMVNTLTELTLRTSFALTAHLPRSMFFNVSWSRQRNEAYGQYYISSPNLTHVPRSLSQTIPVSMTSPETVYRAHYGWLGGAIAVIVLAILAILPTFYGWWRLGRTVSLSPVEIALAFDAPLLAGADPNGSAYAIVQAVGDRKTRYGEEWSSSDRKGSVSTEHNQTIAMVQNDGKMLGRSGSTEIRVVGTRRLLHFGPEGTTRRPEARRRSGSEPDMIR